MSDYSKSFLSDRENKHEHSQQGRISSGPRPSARRPEEEASSAVVVAVKIAADARGSGTGASGWRSYEAGILNVEQQTEVFVSLLENYREKETEERERERKRRKGVLLLAVKCLFFDFRKRKKKKLGPLTFSPPTSPSALKESFALSR